MYGIYANIGGYINGKCYHIYIYIWHTWILWVTTLIYGWFYQIPPEPSGLLARWRIRLRVCGRSTVHFCCSLCHWHFCSSPRSIHGLRTVPWQTVPGAASLLFLLFLSMICFWIAALWKMNQKAHLGKATSTLYSKELFFPVLLRLDVGRILGITCDRWNFAFIKKKTNEHL